MLGKVQPTHAAGTDRQCWRVGREHALSVHILALTAPDPLVLRSCRPTDGLSAPAGMMMRTQARSSREAGAMPATPVIRTALVCSPSKSSFFHNKLVSPPWADS
eukprot:1503850-Rhodomonas_salina.1